MPGSGQKASGHSVLLYDHNNNNDQDDGGYTDDYLYPINK